MEKNVYQKRMEETLEEFSTPLESLKQQVDNKREEARERLQTEMRALEDKRLAAKGQLEDVQNASSEAWTRLRSGLDKAVDDMKSSYDHALARLKQIGS